MNLFGIIHFPTAHLFATGGGCQRSRESDEAGSIWKEIAARDPIAFEQAQLDYIGGKQYVRVVRTVHEKTGLDLNARAFAVREATWSTAVQHGKAAKFLPKAIAATDATLARDDPRYDEELIGNLYAARVAFIRHCVIPGIKSDPSLNAREKSGRIALMQSIIDNRMPKELKDALELLLKIQNERD